MDEATLQTLTVGAGADARDIAVLRREGTGPDVVFLIGFRSDMAGSKATALDAWGAETGRAVVRFDYSGHGRSGGRFEDGTIGRWLEEAEAVGRASAASPSCWSAPRSAAGSRCCSRRS